MSKEVKNNNLKINTQKTYPAKLLLTGEYSVLKGGSAVLLPLPIFKGQWKKETEKKTHWVEFFKAFIEYLRKNSSTNAFLDTRAMEEAFESGYFLASNVPQGFGLGSSGVFCAAVYDVFGIKGINETVADTRDRLRLMENFFHGNSSGLDPLVSYHKQAVLLKDRELKLLKTRKKTPPKSFPDIWLLDSETGRSTAQLVRSFEEYLNEPKNQLSFFESYMPLVEKATREYIEGDFEDWYQSIQVISRLQIEIFKPMIPGKIFDIWISGLESNSYYMKLCGAGGGGFFFLFSKKTRDELFDFKGFRITDYLSGLITDQ